MAKAKFNPQNLYKKALRLHSDGKFWDADQLYRKIIRADPKFGPAYHYLCDALLRQGKGDDALKVLELGLQRNPGSKDMLNSASSMYQSLGMMEKAMEWAHRAIRKFPEQAEFHYNLGTLHLANQQRAEAIAAMEKAVELKNDFAQAHYNLGTLYFDAGDNDKAAKSFESTIALDPKMIQAFNNYGYVLAHLRNYDQAQKQFDAALALDPNYGPAWKNKGMTHHLAGEIDEARQAYDEAMKTLAEDAELHALIGNLFRDRGQADQAIPYYEEALRLDPNQEVAKKNINQLEKQRISGWHLDMIADEDRNNAFEAALKKVVTPDTTVLDIGTGSGLLAMMAARAGAKSVVACEMVPTLAATAAEIVKANGYSDTVKVHNKKSTSLEMGKDLPEKADVLVSEILDTGLLGEGVLPSFRHALNHQLKPGAAMIPQGAEVIAQLIQCDALKSVYPVKTISGFDLSGFDKYRVDGEYISKDLRMLEHVALSDPFSTWTVDFRNPPKIADPLDPNITPITITPTKDGQLHAVAFWFNLHVDDDIHLSSGPDGEMVHWGQAIYFPEEVKSVKAGEPFEMNFIQNDLLIQFEHTTTTELKTEAGMYPK